MAANECESGLRRIPEPGKAVGLDVSGNLGASVLSNPALIGATLTDSVDMEQLKRPAALIRFDKLSKKIGPHLKGLLQGGKGLDADARKTLSRDALSTAFDVDGITQLFDDFQDGKVSASSGNIPGWRRETEFMPGGVEDADVLIVSDYSPADPAEALVTRLIKSEFATTVSMRRLRHDSKEELTLSLEHKGHWVSQTKEDDDSARYKGVMVTFVTSPSGEIIDSRTTKIT